MRCCSKYYSTILLDNCLCDTIINIVISAIETNEEFNVPKSNPPLSMGFVKKSPNVAPNGLENINAIQNRIN